MVCDVFQHDALQDPAFACGGSEGDAFVATLHTFLVCRMISDFPSKYIQRAEYGLSFVFAQ